METIEYTALTNNFVRSFGNTVVRYLTKKYNQHYRNNNQKGIAKINRLNQMGKPKKFNHKKVNIGHMSGLVITPSAQAQNPESPQIMLYCHGGGYIYSSPENHASQVATLVNASGITALVFAYGLAPEHQYPSQLNDALVAYKYLIEEQGYTPENIIPVGDSAGGHLVVQLLLHLRDKKAVLPKKAVTFYPLCDPTAQHDSVQYNTGKDTMLTEKAINMMADLAFGSPENKVKYGILNKDLSGLPPILVQIGTYDCLYSENVALIAQLKEAGNQGRAEIYYEMPHAWIAFPKILKEAQLALQNFGQFLNA